MKVELAIFDFDGTLADSMDLFLSVSDEVADHFRFPRLDRSELENLRQKNARELLKLHRIPLWKAPLIVNHARRLMARDIQRISLFPGMQAVLHRFAEAGVLLSVVSSNAELTVRQVLGHECAGLIRYYACGAALFGKADKYRRVLRLSGVRPERAISIGDELRDAEAAREAGIPFGAVTWGITGAAALRAYNPAYVFERVEELADRLL